MFLCLAITLAAFAYLYVTREHFIYVWDWNGYFSVARIFCEALKTSPVDALKMLGESLKGEYNLFFAVPISALFGWDTESRPLFIVALAALYLSTACTVIGLAMRKAFPQFGARGMWCAALLYSIVPPAWEATMRGFPDTMGVTCVFAALYALMSDTQLKQTRTILWTAFWLAAAMAIRRHLAYAAIAVHLTAAISVYAGALTNWRYGSTLPNFAPLVRAALRPAWLALSSLLFLVILDPYLILNVIQNDYSSLYASYQKTPLELASYYFHDVVGPAFFAVGLLGCVIGIIAGARRLDGRFVLGVYAISWLLTWLTLARQTGIHQAIVGLPLVPIFGFFAIFSALRSWHRDRLAKAFVIIAGLYTLANATLIYGTAVNLNKYVHARLPIFSRYAGPLRRDDFPSLRAMIDELRSGRQPTLVAASSTTLNFDIVAQGEKRFYKTPEIKLAVEVNPQIDSRDPLPIESLLGANQIVSVTPFQHHIDADRQQVVKSINDEVASGIASADFAPVRKHYPLEQGAVATVYRRVRQTPLSDAVSILQNMSRSIPATNKKYRDYWYVAPHGAQVGFTWETDGSRDAYMFVPPGETSLTLLRKTTNPITWSAHIAVGDDTCRGITLSVGTQHQLALTAGQNTSLDVLASPDQAEFVTVRVANNGTLPCHIDLTHMRTSETANSASAN
ncbi:hypothetical protein AWB74_03725 [Caballeronia arvi]|uniref:Glycosyltransferase RgtA/B/C/D-like domain-containing protein n=1 Tax=Caballeronia arvi TaxID=1777135 RepID=A0A158JDP5_9BURK|nr:hypothetical protein [Caballeronia arvi]SAL66450.1 hypothetical protein AWB74_03725 [Caballeronia arvi]